MPPPAKFDPWLGSRRFGIVIDAGSSGSRLQLYSWRDARVVRMEMPETALGTLPTVSKGSKNAEDWIKKVEPGLSTFGNNLDGIPEYLQPLLDHALDAIPPHLHAETPLFLMATAGMRLLPLEQQKKVLKRVCEFFRTRSDFKLEARSDIGPCGSSIRIISGEEEGLFGWIAINYLMDGFSSGGEQRQTYGFLDMGGASTQIAFEPLDTELKSLQNVRLRLLDGSEISHKVFVTTWLGYGTNQARERYVGQMIEAFEDIRDDIDDDVVLDPCLPSGLQRKETPVHVHTVDSHAKKPHMLLGTGNFTQCIEQTAPLLNKHAPCPEDPCLFAGKHVPSIDFSVSRFIGVSEYWYSSEHVFGLGGAYDFVQYGKAAKRFCSQDWSTIVAHHDRLRKAGQVGGDGEVEVEGEVVDLGKWGPEVELARLEMQCFKAAWVVNVLHEGVGLPRISDPGGNPSNADGAVLLEEHAKGKGLGSPAFQSLDSVNDTAISWTLGKIVLEASKEVIPSSPTAAPLVDPLQPIPENPFTAPYRPGLLDFDYLENKIGHHLPILDRDVFGFSLITALIYGLWLLVISFVAYRLRHRIRITVRRVLRKSALRAERESLNLEDANGNSDPPSFSPAMSGTSSLVSLQIVLRHMLSSVGFAGSRTKSYSTIPLSVQSNNNNGYVSDSSYSHSVRARSSPRATTFYHGNSASTPPSRQGSPPPQQYIFPRKNGGQNSYDDDHDVSTPQKATAFANILSNLSRSRNSSTNNLMPRTTTTSLSSRSGTQSPAHPSLDDEY